MALSIDKIQDLVKQGNHVVFSLAGLSFECVFNHNFQTRQEAIQHLVENLDAGIPDITKLTLTHQPDNPYDPNAVIVTMYDGTDIGFVPKDGRFSFAKESRPDLWMLGQIDYAGINTLFTGVETECHLLSLKPSRKNYGIVVEAWHKTPRSVRTNLD